MSCLISKLVQTSICLLWFSIILQLLSVTGILHSYTTYVRIGRDITGFFRLQTILSEEFDFTRETNAEEKLIFLPLYMFQMIRFQASNL